MGFSANGQCFGSAVEAAQTECNAYPRTDVSSSGVVSWTCAGPADDGSSISLVRHGTDGSTAAQTLVVSYPSCDESAAYSQMTDIWALGLTACVGVYVVKAFIYKLVTNQ